MFNPNWIPLLVALNVSYCGVPSGGGSSDNEFQMTCYEYSLMLNLEADAAGTCSYDEQCGQVLTGTGDCSTDDRIANNSEDMNWFFDTLEEAEAAGCNIDFGTSGRCDPSAEPVCRFSQCGWE